MVSCIGSEDKLARELSVLDRGVYCASFVQEPEATEENYRSPSASSGPVRLVRSSGLLSIELDGPSPRLEYNF
jgi:hypothetical protein